MLYNLELSPGIDLLGLPLVSCLLNVGEMLGRKQEQSWTTPLGVPELRLLGQNPLSPLKRVRMGETWNAFVCNYGFFFLLSGLSVCYPLPAPESVIKTN